MEDTESTTRARMTATAVNRNQEAGQAVLMDSKPLHRFIRKEPKSLGIVILICGCAEFLMGFQLAGESVHTSCVIYIPFWQGALFLVCGILSIYTEVHPSKKMVTVCLAMYVVSLLGILVSIIFRIGTLIRYMVRWDHGDDPWDDIRYDQLFGIDLILSVSSLCVSVLLIFLCVVSRIALKSTRTQVIVQCIPAPPRDAPSN